MSWLEAFAPRPSHSGFLLAVKVLGVVLFAGAVPLAVGLVAILSEARRSDAWPEAVATIKHSKVSRSRDGRFSPDILYAFEIDGKQ